MSTYHLRRVLLDAIEEMREDTPHLTDYERCAAYGGVYVGTDRSVEPALAYFDVAGPDREGLPGEYAAASYDELEGSARAAVLEAAYENEDGEVVRCKERDLSAGAVVAAIGLRPHAWFGGM